MRVLIDQSVVFAIRTIKDLCIPLTESFGSLQCSTLDSSKKTKSTTATARRGCYAGPEMNNLLTAGGLSATFVSPPRPVTMLYHNSSRDMQTRSMGYTTVFVRKTPLFTSTSIGTSLDQYGIVCFFGYIHGYDLKHEHRGRTRTHLKKQIQNVYFL